MTDPIIVGFLIILLILLTIVWTYPLIKAEIKRNIRFLVLKACLHIIAALVLFGLAADNWSLDIYHVLHLVAGLSLLYEGAITILNIYEDMKKIPVREKGM
ncbi:MAG TPA: hypothetical protein VN429_09215 [Methanospirillum sp.]|uniref:hypothetical protein n=1 Tax=Methanospirillum sp. TaxID=45200 RepID=UPI002C296AF8|nr:hypothetical protein [Methanospirillum sp.]HWQ64581.1 hypothetical protein [Methanospirillum sp.]